MSSVTWTSDPESGIASPEVRILRPRGELDIATVDEFDRALREVPPTSHLVIDLAEVTFVDSVTLSRLVRAARLHESAGTAVVLAGAAGIVSRVLSITQLDVVLRCTTTVPEAEALLASHHHDG
ncbi:MAG TPA: STAS domain-containing protein [Candidatus Nanopelagicales bacterium]|nr:STAS domain-containing protein [Candidatus Nanopelagicales bacterium]